MYTLSSNIQPHSLQTPWAPAHEAVRDLGYNLFASHTRIRCDGPE